MFLKNLKELGTQIRDSCERHNRSPTEISLIGVSKTKSLEDLIQAYEAGLRQFGENFVEEFTEKESAFHPEDLAYHFIGRLPRKKVRKVVGKANLIHTVSSIDLANKINLVAKEENAIQAVLIQVNQASESSKSGANSNDVLSMAAEMDTLSSIRLLGLMSIPPFDEPAKPYFSDLRKLRNDVSKALSLPLPFLSMGMSADFDDAISEGATHIRIGTAIFGKRN